MKSKKNKKNNVVWVVTQCDYDDPEVIAVCTTLKNAKGFVKRSEGDRYLKYDLDQHYHMARQKNYLLTLDLRGNVCFAGYTQLKHGISEEAVNRLCVLQAKYLALQHDISNPDTYGAYCHFDAVGKNREDALAIGKGFIKSFLGAKKRSVKSLAKKHLASVIAEIEENIMASDTSTSESGE